MPTNTKALQVAEPVTNVAGKNAIINGAMDVWQRGTSFTATGWTADRWYLNADSGVATTTSRSTDAPTGFRYSIKFQRTAGNTATGAHGIGQSFETSESIRFAGKTVTYSFYAKRGANYSAASNLLEWRVGFSTGTDQSITNAYGGWTSYSEANFPAAALTTSWQRFTMTFNVPAGTTQISVRVFQAPVGTAGADDSYYITGFQFEEGSVATPFSRAGGTYQGELAACMRYYQRRNSVNNVLASGGFSYSTTLGIAHWLAVVPFRANPTSIDYSNIKFQQYDGTEVLCTPAINQAASEILNLQFTANTGTPFTAGRWGYPYGNGGGYLGLSAEL